MTRGDLVRPNTYVSAARGARLLLLEMPVVGSALVGFMLHSELGLVVDSTSIWVAEAHECRIEAWLYVVTASGQAGWTWSTNLACVAGQSA